MTQLSQPYCPTGIDDPDWPVDENGKPVNFIIHREYAVGQNGEKHRLHPRYMDDDGNRIPMTKAEEQVFLVLAGAGWTDTEYATALHRAKTLREKRPAGSPAAKQLELAITLFAEGTAQ